MNRKNFLATLGAALVAPFLPKISASTKNPNFVGADKSDFDALEQSLHKSRISTDESIKSIEELTKTVEASKRKIGYISIDHCPEGTSFVNDWNILMDEPFDASRKIQRLNDIEGWYEYLTYENPWHAIHVKASFRIVYTGNDPRYAAFKSA